jgi:hypothetical protein
MVVVDNARKLISKTIDIVVTSVLQTTAGKMIFGRYVEPASVSQPASSQAAASAQPPSPSIAHPVSAPNAPGAPSSPSAGRPPAASAESALRAAQQP